jgi:hypothetical protein
MSMNLPENMMNCFKPFVLLFVRHGRYLNTLSICECQKASDAINLIVSDLLSGGDFPKKRLFRYSTLSICECDAINLIVEFTAANAPSWPFYAPIGRSSDGLNVQFPRLINEKIDVINDVFDCLWRLFRREYSEGKTNG